MDFKVGDVVRLKSGGPVMTVVGVDENDAISVAWFTQDHHSNWDCSQEAEFPAFALEKQE